MSRVIANALVLFPDERPSPNLRGQAVKPSEVYLKNSYCSLFSAKAHNPGVDLALVYDGSIPQEYRVKFEKLGVQLLPLPFETFVVPERFPWRAGYYKLDVQQFLAARFEQVLLVDTDTVVMGPLDDLWDECRTKVLLFETGHRLSHGLRSVINRFGQAVDGRVHRALHWGGEAIAFTPAVAQSWLEACRQVHRAMAERWDFFDASNPDQGDELVLSLAAEAHPELVQPINPYLERYWTMSGFRLLSTNYRYNPVDIWHLPWEKRTGMLALYRSIERTGRLPGRGDLIRMLHLEVGMVSGLIWQLRKVKRWFVPAGPGGME